MSTLTSAVTQMAQVLTPGGSVVTPSSSAAATSTTETGISPAKMANLRSNYLQQIRDFHRLYESGAISEAEFREQKVPILEQLKKLHPG